MRRYLPITALAFILAGCATDPSTSDPDGFRTSAQQTVERVINLPADTTANNLNRGAIKCWESSDLRVSFSHSPQGYNLFISTYAGSSRTILFMADVTPISQNQSRIIVRHKYPHDSHKRYAENLADWADNSAKKCNSLVFRE